jgi:hypothetical protein
MNTDKYIYMTMPYPIRKATEELKGFHSAEAVKKIGRRDL